MIRCFMIIVEGAMRPCDDYLAETIRMTESMLRLADEGDGAREDVGCGVLYGVLRDSAYRIRRIAEQEREAHIRKGWWNENENKEGENG